MLIENKRLQYLNIGSNKIGTDGVRYVTEGLHYNTTLTELWLNNSDISTQGMYNHHIAQFIDSKSIDGLTSFRNHSILHKK